MTAIPDVSTDPTPDSTVEPDTRRRLLDAAEERFAEVGYRATSVREITQRGRCNLAAINYHFGGKANLYREVFHRRLALVRDQRLRSIRQSLDAATDDSGLERLLSSFTTAFLQPLSEASHGRVWFELVAQELRDPQLSPQLFFDEMVHPLEAALVSALTQLCPSLAAEDAELCVHSLIAQLVHAINYRRCLERAGRSGFELAKLERHLVRFTAAGIRRAARTTT